METPWPYTNYPAPTAYSKRIEVLLARKACELVRLANEEGFDLTIEQVPTNNPPAMGNTFTHVEVRPRRIKA